MNIALVVSSMGPGGAERVAATLCNAWSDKHRVTLITTFSRERPSFYHLSDRVDLVHLAAYSPSSRRSLWGYWNRFWSLRRLIRELKVEVVVSFMTEINIAVLLATVRLGIPVIACERVDPASTRAAVAMLRSMVYSLARVVVVQTFEAGRELAKRCRGMQNVKVIPNPLPADIPYKSARSASDHRRYRLLTMGRLVSQKQHCLLIAAFSRLAQKHASWDLWIWGEGPLRLPLEEQVRTLQLSNRVLLPGLTKEPWSELAQADAFVLTSAFEGFPNALLEAMAMGLPCVAFDCPTGPREMSSGGKDLLLIHPQDLEELERQLDTIMADPSLRLALGTRAATSVRQRYHVDVVAAKWQTVLGEVAGSTLGAREPIFH